MSKRSLAAGGDGSNAADPKIQRMDSEAEERTWKVRGYTIKVDGFLESEISHEETADEGLKFELTNQEEAISKLNCQVGTQSISFEISFGMKLCKLQMTPETGKSLSGISWSTKDSIMTILCK